MKKIFMALVVLFVLFMIAAIAIPVIYKDKVVETIKEEINKNLNAEVDSVFILHFTSIRRLCIVFCINYFLAVYDK